ncbi:hypothetical protein NE237_027706 [Protea cynaroides]|uniref:Phytocyanin domain-containing protein n=1 Tax=Protea cynaroides TaxID=273540 RepID=A0A9Q0GSE1_9MAGN|nr:hypothetical protein NE237_027706 [Protea cynaroides]
MASLLGVFFTVLIAFSFSMNPKLAHASTEFKVGDNGGWLEPINNTQIYNQWAAHNRFHVGDSLYFEYKNDSVLVVDKWDYYHCNSSKPIFSFNDGKTVIKLDKPGPFYFISADLNHSSSLRELFDERYLRESLQITPEKTRLQREIFLFAGTELRDLVSLFPSPSSPLLLPLFFHSPSSCLLPAVSFLSHSHLLLPTSFLPSPSVSFPSPSSPLLLPIFFFSFFPSHYVPSTGVPLTGLQRLRTAWDLNFRDNRSTGNCVALVLLLQFPIMASSSRQETDMMKWSKADVDVLVTVMVEEVVKGNKTTSTFNRVGWANIKQKLKEKVGRVFHPRQLKNKLCKLRTEYSNFRSLVRSTVMGWDDPTRSVICSDDNIWDTLIKENPGWAKYRRNGLPQYTELCIIFGDSYATGSNAFASTQEWLDEDDEEIDITSTPQTTTQSAPPFVDLGDEPVHPSKNAHNLDRTPTGIRKKKKTSEIVGAIKEMVEHSRARLEFFTASSSPSPTSIVTSSGFSIASCVKFLDSMPDLDRELYVRAVYHMQKNP